MVSSLGWLDGLTSGGILLSCSFFGLICLYEARKYRIKLLVWAGFTNILLGLFWLGPFSDLLSVLITGKNITPIYVYGFLSYGWTGPGIVVAMYLGAELLVPDKKWYVVGFYAVLGTIFQIFLWFDTLNIFIFTLKNPGEDLIDASIKRTHICYFLIVIFLISAFIFLGMGFIIKAIQSQGVVRKKATYLSLGYNIFIVCATLESVIPPGVAIGFIRCVMMTFSLWMYLGLREEPEQKLKLKPRKDITVEGSLFRISHTKPEEITEEQITFYKEQKICLVCKSKAIRYIYICPKCETLYCEHCARTVEDTENACWYCGIAFNESKPIRPYKKEEAKFVDIEKSKKHPKEVQSSKK